MYVQRFGLAHEPFSIAPDPRFLFMSERHREALAHLLYGLQGGGGFVVLTGEIGAGKTTVCRCFLEKVPAHCNVAYIFNPRLTDTELLKTICDEFRIALPDRAGAAPTIKHYLDPLNAFLLQAHAQGRNNVLIIDEAQNLSPSLLEQLRLLTNLETAERKLLQIILIGQPELREMLAAPALAPLAQRVIARYHLQALGEAESEAYIRHRLGVAGFSGALPFDAAALRRIHALARGVPRRINLLCDRALLGAYGGGHAAVDKRIVEQAAREVFDEAAPAHAPRQRMLLAAVLGAMAGAAVLAGAGSLLLRPAGGNDAAARDVAALALAGDKAVAASAPSPARAGSSANSSSAARLAATATTSSAAFVASAVSSSGPGTGQPAGNTMAELSALVADLPRDERQAWRALAALWPAADKGAGAADPCAADQPLRCHRAVLTLAQVRQLARPGLLVLQDEAGVPAYALLLGLGDSTATLQLGQARRSVPLAALARWWRGEFATLWLAPEGLPTGAGRSSSQALADWLGQQLKNLAVDDPGSERPVRQRIAAFQLAQGLKPDGVPGPMTMMQLNRAAGVAEPRLLKED